MSGKPPDLEVTAYDKERKSGMKIGVAWSQPDGSFAIYLNPGAAIIAMPHMAYKVKPIVAAAPAGPQKTGSWKPPERPAPPRPIAAGNGFDDLDDDIPF